MPSGTRPGSRSARTPTGSTGAGAPGPDDERAAIERHVRERERLGEDLAVLDRDIVQDALGDEAIRWRLTITGVHRAVAAGLMAAIGRVDRSDEPPRGS